MKKEIEEDTNKWKAIHYAQRQGVLTSLKCLYHPKQSADSMQFLPRYQWHITYI